MYDLHDIVEMKKTSRLPDEPLGSHSNGRRYQNQMYELRTYRHDDPSRF